MRRPPFTIVSHVNDPVWGAVGLTQLELRLLQEPPLVRLGRIRQMGLAYLQEPSLTHSRLEHSIGVMHVADQMFAKVARPGRQGYLRPAEFPHFRQAVRIAALLHDLGHPPYSHAVERTFLRYPSLLSKASDSPTLLTEERTLLHPDHYSHEAFTHLAILRLPRQSPGLAKDLKKAIPRSIPITEIADLAVGKARGRLARYNALLSGDFDADRIDYLLRDNRRSGYTIGLDLRDLYDAIHLKTGENSLFIDRRALPFVNSVLAARERLIHRVHRSPGDRGGNQILMQGLFYILDRLDPPDLARVIMDMHTVCTDVSFDHEIQRHSLKFTSPSPRRYFVRRLTQLSTHPTVAGVWPVYAYISFMRMHPGVRALAHIVAFAHYQSPSQLLFRCPNGSVIILDIFSKHSQGSSLLVDYEERQSNYVAPDLRWPEDDLDYIAASENRTGRALLHESLAQLELYAYRLDDFTSAVSRAGPQDECIVFPIDGDENKVPPVPPVPEQMERDRHYFGSLDLPSCHLLSSVISVARTERDRWRASARGMMPLDFLLVVLSALESWVRNQWRDARSVYVFRGERFINDYLLQGRSRSAVPGGLKASEQFPIEFRAEDPQIAARRIFSSLQRLILFGLVETRRVTVVNKRRVLSEATRRGVYSTREDFRISIFGRDFVENEPGLSEPLGAVTRQVTIGQSPHLAALEHIAKTFYRMNSEGGSDRLERVMTFEEEAEAVAEDATQSGGCMMLFSLKPN